MESISGGPCDRSTTRVDGTLVTEWRVDRRRKIDSALLGSGAAWCSTLDQSFGFGPTRFEEIRLSFKSHAVRLQLCGACSMNRVLGLGRRSTFGSCWMCRHGGRRGGAGDGSVGVSFFPLKENKAGGLEQSSAGRLLRAASFGARGSPARIDGDVGPSRSTPLATVAVGPGACPLG